MNETTKNLAIALERYIGKFGDCGDVYYQAKKAMDNYRAEQEKPNNEIKLLNTTDAMVWATEFNKIYPMILKDGEGVTDSKEVLLTWFANAIMAGYDHARRKYEPKNKLVELDYEKLVVSFEKFLEPHTCGWKIKQSYIDNGEHFKDWIKEICQTFGKKRVSVEDILEVIDFHECHHGVPRAVYESQFENLAQAIHKLIYGGGE